MEIISGYKQNEISEVETIEGNVRWSPDDGKEFLSSEDDYF